MSAMPATSAPSRALSLHIPASYVICIDDDLVTSMQAAIRSYVCCNIVYNSQ